MHDEVTTAGSTDGLLADALARLEALERRVAEQDAELAALRQRGARSSSAADDRRDDRLDDPSDRQDRHGPPGRMTPPDRPDRRTVLRHAGVALAGAAATTAIVEAATASPAAAADGDALKLGQANSATSTTSLSYDASSLTGNILTVADGDTSGATGAAIAGVASGPPDLQSPAVAQHGVIGKTNAEGGIAVWAHGAGAESYGVLAMGDKAPLRLMPSIGDPRTSPTQHNFGEIMLDLQGNLWVCVASGGPGTWRKLGGTDTVGALHLLATPARVYDSRTSFTPNDVTKGQLTNAQERVIDATHNNGVPPSSLAALVNLTATNTNAGGWLAAFENGITFPGTSTLNWSAAGTNIANAAIVALDAQGKFKVRCAGSCDFAVDVVGYCY